MPARSLLFRGSYQNTGKIQLTTGTILEWHPAGTGLFPRIPYGSFVEVQISFQERDYLNGSEGIVWATYDLRQAEIIRNALLPQNITCDLEELALEMRILHLLKIPEFKDVQSAVDFIWRQNSGLRLKPDWEYPAGAENESFNKWIEGI
ncbi:MAG: hypothetical protein WAN36_07330 [Calditrichia bacterium]